MYSHALLKLSIVVFALLYKNINTASEEHLGTLLFSFYASHRMGHIYLPYSPLSSCSYLYQPPTTQTPNAVSAPDIGILLWSISLM